MEFQLEWFMQENDLDYTTAVSELESLMKECGLFMGTREDLLRAQIKEEAQYKRAAFLEILREPEWWEFHFEGKTYDERVVSRLMSEVIEKWEEQTLARFLREEKFNRAFGRLFRKWNFRFNLAVIVSCFSIPFSIYLLGQPSDYSLYTGIFSLLIHIVGLIFLSRKANQTEI